jgi:hypothetical protein
MRYVLLMGRGIEGTGNTKYAVELQAYLEKNKHDVTTIANCDKKWGREKSHENTIKQYSFENQTDEVLNTCKQSDCVIVLSTPAKNYPEFSKMAFYDIIKDIYESGVKVVYIQVDHKIQSINRNFYAEWEYTDVFDYFTKVFTHSRNGDFVRFCDSHGIDTRNFIYGDDGCFVGINGLDWDKYKKYWKPFYEKDPDTIKFIGRSANWKGPWLLRDIHNSHFRKEGFITSIEGIEGSIQTVKELYKETKPERIPRDDVILKLKTDDKKLLDANEIVMEKDKPVYIFPPYDNDKALERMSKSYFGIELLLLEDKVLKNIMEYAMMEIIAVGTIPVFRKRWGEMFKVDGKPLIEHRCGTIFMDENNPQEAIDTMQSVIAAEEMAESYSLMRREAFDFYSKYFNSDRNFGELVKLINEI